MLDSSKHIINTGCCGQNLLYHLQPHRTLETSQPFQHYVQTRPVLCQKEMFCTKHLRMLLSGCQKISLHRVEVDPEWWPLNAAFKRATVGLWVVTFRAGMQLPLWDVQPAEEEEEGRCKPVMTQLFGTNHTKVISGVVTKHAIDFSDILFNWRSHHVRQKHNSRVNSQQQL